MDKIAIKQTLDLMIDSIGDNQVKLYKSLIDKKCYDKINNIDEFYFGLIYPFEQFISGLIKIEISKNEDIVFILKYSNFIKSHFENWIKKIEGSACCADKSSVILKSLYSFFKDNKSIEFNYNQEYTYHLPKTIFNTHDKIIDFYKSIKNLKYGHPDLYFKEVEKLIKFQSCEGQ